MSAGWITVRQGRRSWRKSSRWQPRGNCQKFDVNIWKVCVTSRSKEYSVVFYNVCNATGTSRVVRISANTRNQLERESYTTQSAQTPNSSSSELTFIGGTHHIILIFDFITPMGDILELVHRTAKMLAETKKLYYVGNPSTIQSESCSIPSCYCWESPLLSSLKPRHQFKNQPTPIKRKPRRRSSSLYPKLIITQNRPTQSLERSRSCPGPNRN